jgi:hypothetical protein
VNFGTPVPLLIGIVLILGGVALFFVDRLKPGYGRDSDKVYAVLWLISGVFLLGHLNMELLASFQQLLMAGMLITVTIQNVYARTPREDRYAPQPAGGGRDDYYRPSRPPQDYRSSSPRMNVRAELDNEGPYRPRFPEDRRMIGGREEPPRRSGYYEDGYGDRYGAPQNGYPDRPTPPSDRPVERLNPSGDRIRRRAKPSAGRYDIPPARGWDEAASGYAANSGGYSANSGGYSANGGGYSANGDSYSGNAGAGYSAASEDNYVGSGGYSSHSSPEAGDAAAGNGGDDSYVDYRPVNNYPSDDAGQPPADYGSRQY